MKKSKFFYLKYISIFYYIKYIKKQLKINKSKLKKITYIKNKYK